MLLLSNPKRPSICTARLPPFGHYSLSAPCSYKFTTSSSRKTRYKYTGDYESNSMSDGFRFSFIHAHIVGNYSIQSTLKIRSFLVLILQYMLGRFNDINIRLTNNSKFSLFANLIQPSILYETCEVFFLFFWYFVRFCLTISIYKAFIIIIAKE